MWLAGVVVWSGEWGLDHHPVHKQISLDLSACGIVWVALKNLDARV